MIFLFYFFKCFYISGVSKFLQKWIPTPRLSFLYSWILVEVFIIFILALLSSAQIMVPLYFRLVWLAGGLLVIYYRANVLRETIGKTRAFLKAIPRVRISNCIAVSLFIFLFGLLAARSFYYYDTTGDGLVYGNSRVGIWYIYHSIFINFNIEALNIFTNEWNAELQALAAVLFAGNDQAMNFMGLEVFLFGTYIAYTFFRFWGLDFSVGLIAALAIATTPALLGLSFLMKGDLFGIYSLLLAFVTLYFDFNSEVIKRLFICVALAFAAGSKILFLPFFCVYMALMIFDGADLYRQGLRSIGFIFLIALSLLRYSVNFFVFGNPIQRIVGEKVDLSIGRIAENIKNILFRTFSIFDMADMEKAKWIQNEGLGFIGFLCLVLFLVKRKKILFPWKQGGWRFWSGFFVSLSYALLGLVWYEWSYRYFLGWILILCVGILAFQMTAMKSYSQKCILFVCLVAIVYWQCHFISNAKEVLPWSLQKAMDSDSLDRKLAFHSYFNSPDLQKLYFGNPLQILIYQEADSLLFPFLGENFKNHVVLAKNLDAFLVMKDDPSFKFVVLSGPGVTQKKYVLDLIRETSRFRTSCFFDKYFICFERN